MKHFALLACLMAATGAMYAQTTLEEYNFITKGYKTQIDNGLDMKKGYKFIDLIEEHMVSNTINRTMSFKGLYRTGETTPCAVMVIYRRTDTNFIDYTCVPHFKSSPEIWQMYLDHVKATYSGEAANAMLLGLAKCVAFFAQNN